MTRQIHILNNNIKLELVLEIVRKAEPTDLGEGSRAIRCKRRGLRAGNLEGGEKKLPTEK